MVLADLRRLGLVQSQKGKNGGYRLACDPGQVNLLRLHNCLAGGVVDSLRIPELNDAKSDVVTIAKADRWLSGLLERWLAELARTSLADLRGLAEAGEDR